MQYAIRTDNHKLTSDHFVVVKFYLLVTGVTISDFPKPDLEQILAPSQFENEQKLPKMVNIIPNFLVLHFGENFM